MKLLHYFDLGLAPDEAVLGQRTKAQKRKRNLQQLFLTFTMYVFVWLGILGQRILTLYNAGIPVNRETIRPEFLLVAFAIATAIFPAVFPKTFAKMPKEAQKVGTVGWFIVQLCVSFQQGFFWQALLSLIVSKG